MPQFNNTDAYRMATELVKAALESKAISLVGPSAGRDSALMAELDGKYLTTLLNALAKNLQTAAGT